MKKNLLMLLAAVLAAFLSGCGTTAKFVYPARMDDLVQVASAPAHNQTVAVTPFDDFRNQDNTSGTVFLYMIPLMPFGWVEYDRPDAARLFLSINAYDFTPAEDLPKAAAVSLRRSNLFKDAFFTFGGEKDRADLVLRGTIRSTKYLGRVWSYGLSIEGPLLWLLGAPCGNSENTLSLQFELTRKGKVIWDYTFDRTDSTVQGLYYYYGHDCLGYSRLMQDAMNQAITDLARRLGENPDLLKDASDQNE